MRIKMKNWLKNGGLTSRRMASILPCRVLWAPVLLALLTGCATQRTVVLDSNNDLVQLGPDVTGHVYVRIKGVWQLSGDKVQLPEGWYAGPFREADK